MRCYLVCLAVLLFSWRPACAAQKTVTLYLDGARVEQELAAGSGGYLECQLPDSFTPGSLRVKPLGAGSIQRVELVPADKDRRRSREIARLEERIDELQDRLQALSRQEEIFSAAVKAQSGKAPRKSKANPDPVASLQRGTDFALTQLEGVLRGERKCRKALEALQRELAAARRGAVLARVWLTAPRARVSFQVGGLTWTPCYDLRWSGEQTGELWLHAKLPPAERGTRYLVSAGSLSQDLPAAVVPGEFPTLGRYPLTLTGAPGGGEPPRSLAFTGATAALPPGEAALYWRGEYQGSGRYAGSGTTEFSLAK